MQRNVVSLFIEGLNIYGVEISSDFAVRYFSSKRLSVKYSAAIMIQGTRL